MTRPIEHQYLTRQITRAGFIADMMALRGMTRAHAEQRAALIDAMRGIKEDKQ